MSAAETGGAHRRWLARGSPVVAACLFVLWPASPAAALVVQRVTGSATGVAVTGDLGTIAPSPTVNLSATAASPASASGPFTAALPSVALPSSLPFNVFSTGALSVTTSAGRLAAADDTGFVTSHALTQNVILGPAVATATSIEGACTADGRGATGSTVIQGGMLNGQPFPPTPSPAPNTVVPVPGIGTVTLNEQVSTSTVAPGGVVTTRITVNAVHARFQGGAGGILPREQAAEAIIAQVVCESVAAPGTPSTTTTTAPPTPTTVSAPTALPPLTSKPTMPVTGGNDARATGLLAVCCGCALRRALRSAPMPRAG